MFVPDITIPVNGQSPVRAKNQSKEVIHILGSVIHILGSNSQLTHFVG